MKICPCCGKELISKKVLAHYERYIEVDQCENCGGIWFDKYELFSLHPNEVPKFYIPKEYKFHCKELFLCPNDNSSLKVLKDPLIPKDILIYYCDHCLGMWLPFESLKKYKDYQKAKLEKNKVKKEDLPKELEEKINILLKKGEENFERESVSEIEEKMSQFVSVIFIILRILSFFIRK